MSDLIRLIDNKKYTEAYKSIATDPNVLFEKVNDISVLTHIIKNNHSYLIVCLINRGFHSQIDFLFVSHIHRRNRQLLNGQILSQEHIANTNENLENAWHYAIKNKFISEQFLLVHEASENNRFEELINAKNNKSLSPIELIFLDETVWNDVDYLRFFNIFFETNSSDIKVEKEDILSMNEKLTTNYQGSEEFIEAKSQLIRTLSQYLNVNTSSRNLLSEFDAVANVAQLGIVYTRDEFLNHELPTQKLILFPNEVENCDFTGTGGRKDYPVKALPSGHIYCAPALREYLIDNFTDPFDRRVMTNFIYLNAEMIRKEEENVQDNTKAPVEQSEVANIPNILDIMRRQLSNALTVLQEAEESYPRAVETGDEETIYIARQALIGARHRIDQLERMIRQEEMRQQMAEPEQKKARRELNFFTNNLKF